jgi:hypothetical protein
MNYVCAWIPIYFGMSEVFYFSLGLCIPRLGARYRPARISVTIRARLIAAFSTCLKSGGRDRIVVAGGVGLIIR